MRPGRRSRGAIIAPSTTSAATSTLLDTLIGAAGAAAARSCSPASTASRCRLPFRRRSCAKRASASPPNGSEADLHGGQVAGRVRRAESRRTDHAPPGGRRCAAPPTAPHSPIRLPENDPGLESPRMSTSLANSAALRAEQSRLQALRAEAAVEPDPVPTAAPTKQTQVIAIYGKGGIGKSFALANLSYMMAQQGKKVLLIGCDPKSDTTSLLFGGRACPTIIETSAKKKLAGEQVKIGDVCFKRDGVFAMELGGPGSRPRLRRPRHHPRLRAAGEARLPRMGLRLRAARFSRRRGLRRLRPADRPRHVPEGHRGRLERSAVAVRRQQRVLGGGILPQARRQRRRRRPGDQQGRRHGRGAGLRGGGRYSGPGGDSGE